MLLAPPAKPSKPFLRKSCNALTYVKTNALRLSKLLSMPTDDLTHSAEPSAGPPMPHETVSDLLRRQLRNTIAPLGLDIDCAALAQWGKNAGLARFRHQNLVSELKCWSPYVNRRPISNIHLNEPFALLDAANLTELAHAIGQNLALMQGHHVQHTVTLRERDISRPNIALLKGLNFNHIRARVEKPIELQRLQVLKQSLDEFKFDFISLVIPVEASGNDLALHLMEMLSFFAPETLLLECPDDAKALNANLQDMAAMLMQFGYYFQPPAHIVKVRSPLHSRPQDCLRLGPGAQCSLGSMRTSNVVAGEAYQRCLDKLQLPIATCRCSH